MALQQLPISRLIHVNVILTPLAAQAQDLSTLLILGDSNVIDPTERMRAYDTIDAVVSDFGTSAPEYLAAVLWFEQNPQPTKLLIGRWVEVDSAARLTCAPLTTAEQVISLWNIITNGSFTVLMDGLECDVTGLNFIGQTNLNGVASIIQAALAALSTGATVVWDANYECFKITSGTTGATSSVSFLTTEGAGTDISDNLKGRASDSGAYSAPGVDAETAVAAATDFDVRFGQTWYAMVILGASDPDHLAVANYIQAANNKHLYGVSTQEAGVLSALSTTDIAYLLKQLGLTRSVVQYSSENPYSVVSVFGRALTVDYNGNNTVITLMYKQEPGIVPESLTETQIEALEAKNANVFVSYQNDTAILEQGRVSSGAFIDEITGTDWLAVTIMTALYNLLYTSPTKIPQTDSGMHLLSTTIESVCSQAVINGLLAPGVWNSGGFGTLVQGAYLAKGFYVYAPPVANQQQADREARKSVAIQVAAKLAGAVHTVDVTINVNR